MQLLENEPELPEKLGEVPVAVIEKGKFAGAHLLSGANMQPSAIEELFPDLDKSEWPVYQEVTSGRRLHADPGASASGEAAAPASATGNTSPRSPNSAASSPTKRGGGRLHARRDRGDETVGRGQVVKGVRFGDRGRGKDGEELGNFEPGSDVVAKATVLARGHCRPSHLRGVSLLRHARRRPDALGARAERGLGGEGAARPRHPHDGLAAAQGGQVQRVRGQLHYPIGEGKICIGLVAGLDYTDATFSVHDALQLMKTHPFIKKLTSRGGKRVAWGAKTIPSGGTSRCRSGGRARHDGRRRRRASMVNIPTLKGVCVPPLRDARRDVRGENDRRVAEGGRLGQLRGLRRKVRSSRLEKDLSIAQHAPTLLQGLLPRWRLSPGIVTVTKGHFPGGHWKQVPRLRDRDGHRARPATCTSSPTTS